jgi:hypothetical protein
MVVNSNTGMVFSMRSEQYSRDARIRELLGHISSMRSLPRLYKREQLRLRESVGTAVRRTGGWCEMAANQGVSCETVADP